MKNIAIIGVNSYLLQGFEKRINSDKINTIRFNECFFPHNIDIIKNADIIINFSISPRFTFENMDISDILDVKLARLIQNTKGKYIFLSSRKVYPKTKELVTYSEIDKLEASDFYSANKINTERTLMNILPEHKLLICRIANVIGSPVLRQGYKTFVGWICNSFVSDGTLKITQDKNTRKDFITIDFLHKSIVSLIQNNSYGIYNISSNIGLRLIDVCSAYVGKENIFIETSHKEVEDQFILSNKKLIENTNITIDIDHILKFLDVYKFQLTRLRKTVLLAPSS